MSKTARGHEKSQGVHRQEKLGCFRSSGIGLNLETVPFLVFEAGLRRRARRHRKSAVSAKLAERERYFGADSSPTGQLF